MLVDAILSRVVGSRCVVLRRGWTLLSSAGVVCVCCGSCWSVCSVVFCWCLRCSLFRLRVVSFVLRVVDFCWRVRGILER